MILRDLYCDLKLNKSRKIYASWKVEPVCLTKFNIIIQSCISNLNLENTTHIKTLYDLYQNVYFNDIIKQEFKTYKIPFTAFNCLGIYSAHPQNETYWLDRGWNIDQIKEIRSKKFGTCSIDFLLNKGLSIEDAKNKLKIKTEKIQEKSLKTKKETGNFGQQTVENYIKLGFSEEEAIQKMLEIGKKRSTGIKEWNKQNPYYYKNGKRDNQIKYWTDRGFSIEDAKIKVSERQKTFTLEKCIEKLGEEEGIKVFNNRQEKWKISLNKNFKEQGDGRSPSSKFANEIIKSICKELEIEIPKKEKWICSSDGKLRCSYDFTYNHKIIEFNGDFWHMNPSKYNADYFNKRTKKLASEKWESDKQKIELAKSNDYDVLTIWERDYKQYKKQVIEKCIEFLN